MKGRSHQPGPYHLRLGVAVGFLHLAFSAYPVIEFASWRASAFLEQLVGAESDRVLCNITLRRRFLRVS